MESDGESYVGTGLVSHVEMGSQTVAGNTAMLQSFHTHPVFLLGCK